MLRGSGESTPAKRDLVGSTHPDTMSESVVEDGELDAPTDAPASAATAVSAASAAAPSEAAAEDTEPLLEAWIEAKRAKDFGRADQIREQLRAKGVEPDNARPSHRAQQQAAALAAYSAPVAPPQHDATTAAKLDEWVAAKRAKDFATADRLREELRAMGVEPDHARPAHPNAPIPMPAIPPPRMMPPPPAQHTDPTTNAKLDEWVAAKRAKDFATADRLREELRAMGVEPDHARPAHPAAGPPQVDVKLDAWVAAKRAKDFATADRIREELRAMGVEPDHARPAFPAAGGSGGGYPPNRPPPPGAPSAARAPPPPYGHPGQYGPPPDHYGGGYYGDGGHYPPPPGPYGQGGPYGHGGSYGGPPAPHYPPPPYADSYRDPHWDASPWGAPPSHMGYPPGPMGGHHPPPRPPPPGGHAPMHDATVDAKLDAWVAAKRAKDFATADRLREEMRAMGVEPDHARPAYPGGGAGAKRPRL